MQVREICESEDPSAPTPWSRESETLITVWWGRCVGFPIEFLGVGGGKAFSCGVFTLRRGIFVWKFSVMLDYLFHGYTKNSGLSSGFFSTCPLAFQYFRFFFKFKFVLLIAQRKPRGLTSTSSVGLSFPPTVNPLSLCPHHLCVASHTMCVTFRGFIVFSERRQGNMSTSSFWEKLMRGYGIWIILDCWPSEYMTH